MIKRRQLSSEEQVILKNKQTEKGLLKCFISGQIISEDDEIQFDHIKPISKGGTNELNNFAVVLKEFNQRKSDLSLYQIRDNLKLETLFSNNPKGVDLEAFLKFIGIKKRHFSVATEGDTIVLNDGTKKLTSFLQKDEVLNEYYFFAKICSEWIDNDNTEGLQPRIILYKKLVGLRDHLNKSPQLLPSIARLHQGRIKSFDGQHKLAAQILNDRTAIDFKVYISPDDQTRAKKLFEELMRANLDAHTKLAQEPFYTSTLYERLDVIHREKLMEYLNTPQSNPHTESDFVSFLSTTEGTDKKKAKEIIKSSFIIQAIKCTVFNEFTAEASKDSKFPLTVDTLKKFILPNLLYLEPSNSSLGSNQDYRQEELENLKLVAKMICQNGKLNDWVSKKELSDYQRKIKRIWYKGSVITWAPFLKSILSTALDFKTQGHHDKKLYRPKIEQYQLERINTCLDRLFNHQMWDAPEGTQIDSLVGVAKKQTEFFEKQGLSEFYVVTGQPK
jgi:hypothetical protein